MESQNYPACHIFGKKNLYQLLKYPNLENELVGHPYRQKLNLILLGKYRVYASLNNHRC